MGHSKNFNKVKQYYDRKLWNLVKVAAAVGKWITAGEYGEITGEEFK